MIHLVRKNKAWKYTIIYKEFFSNTDFEKILKYDTIFCKVKSSGCEQWFVPERVYTKITYIIIVNIHQLAWYEK
jgi:hypothetical protein